MKWSLVVLADRNLNRLKHIFSLGSTTSHFLRHPLEKDVKYDLNSTPSQDKELHLQSEPLVLPNPPL